MTSFPLVLAQLTNNEQGWLTQKLLGVTLGSAEWVLWLLAVLSILSIAVMLERALFFSSHRLPDSEALGVRLAKGELDAVKAAVSTQKGMEAAVVREAIAGAGKGPDAVEEIIAATVAREKPQYERFLSFLGTLGSNAPFIGLFGTVLGIIKAFHDLGQTGAKGSAIQQTVMAGISEALVATAVGLAVAIPAVVGYNALTRQLKNLTARTNALGHAVVGHLRTDHTPKGGLSQMAAAQQNDEDEIVAINVTPLVDITLVLLIIFMVTASFIVRETVEVDLPKAANTNETVQGLVNVVMDKDAKTYFDGTEVDEAGLKSYIDTALAKDKDTRAIITADQTLNYGRVMHLIDVVKGQGIAKFALNIQKEAAPATATGGTP